jgi:hypothetical protein
MISFFTFSLSNMPDIFWIRWIFFLSIVLVTAAWHFYQNIRFLASRPSNESPYAQSMRTIAWKRSVAIVLLSFACLFFGFMGDARRFHGNQTEAELANAQQENANLNAPKPEDATIQAAMAAYAEDQTDEVKGRYEDNFVSYMYLMSCNKINSDDYSVILQALKIELKNLGITQDLTGSVYSAAQGSYEILYNDVKCDDATVTPVLNGYNAALATMRQMIASDTTASAPSAAAPAQ